METILKSATRTVSIQPGKPTVTIGERINPTGKKRLAEALREGNIDYIIGEAQAQFEAGADILDINVGTTGVDEVALVPRVLQAVMTAVPLPVSLDSSNPEVLKAGLEAHRQIAPEGKPLINSITGEDSRLAAVLPLVAEYKAAVIGLAMDDKGIPATPTERLAVARKILSRAAEFGIPPDDILLDCLAMTVGADSQAGHNTLESISLVKKETGNNMTLGVSNISHGLPERDVVTQTYLIMAILTGVNCPIIDVAKMRPAILSADLLLGRDEYASRYIKDFKKRQKRLEALGKA